VTVDRVREVIVPLLADLDVELYDVDHVGGSLRVTLDRPGGIDVEAITRATRAISAALDEADVVPNAYTLEVSSPGIERLGRDAVTVRCLQTPDGDLPDSDDAPDAVALVARSY